MWSLVAAVAAGGLLTGVGLGKWQQKQYIKRLRRNLDSEVNSKLEGLSGEKDRAMADASERAEHLAADLSQDLMSLEEQVVADEQHAESLEQGLERHKEHVEGRETDLASRFEQLKARRETLVELKKDLEEKVNKISELREERAGATQDEIAEEWRNQLKEEAHLNAQKLSRHVEEQAKVYAENEARHLLDLAIERCGLPPEVNRLSSTVDLPEDEEVRNQVLANHSAVLHTIEELCNVHFLESGENLLYIEAADPFNREIARLSFERFLRGGIFTEAVARKVVEKTEVDLQNMARDAGRRAARILKLKDVHPELLYLVGKLLYRTSYTQNQWQHVVETAYLASLLAAGVGIDPRVAKRAGLLHDIGKILWDESESMGSHALSGAACAAQYGESPEIVHAIAAHHGDEPAVSPLDFIVAAADALSGGRPGARRETVEAYTRRCEEIMRICEGFPAIRKAYVIQGGREVRIEVEPRKVTDEEAEQMAAQISQQISEEMNFPGQIKVMVIREMRISATARGLDVLRKEYL